MADLGGGFGLFLYVFLVGGRAGRMITSSSEVAAEQRSTTEVGAGSGEGVEVEATGGVGCSGSGWIEFGGWVDLVVGGCE